MDVLDEHDVATVETDHVVVRKSLLDLGQDRVAGIRLTATSRSSDPVALALVESFPPSVSMSDVEIHPQYGRNQWTVSAPERRMRYENVVAPGGTVVTIYGVRASPNQLEPFLEAPVVARDQPLEDDEVGLPTWTDEEPAEPAPSTQAEAGGSDPDPVEPAGDPTPPAASEEAPHRSGDADEPASAEASPDPVPEPSSTAPAGDDVPATAPTGTTADEPPAADLSPDDPSAADEPADEPSVADQSAARARETASRDDEVEASASAGGEGFEFGETREAPAQPTPAGAPDDTESPGIAESPDDTEASDDAERPTASVTYRSVDAPEPADAGPRTAAPDDVGAIVATLADLDLSEDEREAIRAALDHDGESSLRLQVAHLQSAVAELAAYGDAFERFVDEVGSPAVAMASLREGQARLSDRLDDLAGDVEAASGARESLDDRVNAVEDRAERLDADVEARLDAVDDRFDAVDERLDEVDERVRARLDDHVDAVAARLDEHVDGVAERLQRVEADVESRVEALDDEVAEARADGERRYAGLDDRLAALESRFDSEEVDAILEVIEAEERWKRRASGGRRPISASIFERDA